MSLTQAQEQVRRFLKKREVPMETISRMTGLSRSWLNKFAAGEIRNARVDNVEKALRAMQKLQG